MILNQKSNHGALRLAQLHAPHSHNPIFIVVLFQKEEPRHRHQNHEEQRGWADQNGHRQRSRESRQIIYLMT